MVSGKKAGIIACSNGVPVSRREQVEKTAGFFGELRTKTELFQLPL